MRYVLEFFTIILPHPTKFCQFFILLIENFNLYSDEDGVKHIRIKARPNKWHENDCPFCHKSCPAYDKHSSRPTTWRGLDWGGILVEVEYQTHRIICLEHGVYVAEVPWDIQVIDLPRISTLPLHGLHTPFVVHVLHLIS